MAAKRATPDVEQKQPTRLTRLRVSNYRCLADVDVPLDSLTAFVGANGSGKTSLLRALDLVLGEAWPSLRSFRIPQDFTEFDTSREIKITVEFDPPTSTGILIRPSIESKPCD